jgi:methylated-DNA-[protein]-cysteine S-methyltransferase
VNVTQDWLEELADRAIEEGVADAYYAPASSPLGKLLVVLTSSGVCRIAFPEEREDRVLVEVADELGPRLVRSNRRTAPLTDALAAYLEGDLESFDVPVDFSLVHSVFRRDVLTRLMDVPRGRVTTYGRLAARVGHPRAARAAGTALAQNPVPIVVPCHRVVPGSGGIGNYGGGVERKRWLLELEGALSE